MEAENILVHKLGSLLEVGKALAAEKDLTRLLSLILVEVTQVMEADRSSVFLVDKEKQELWSKVAQGLEVREIRIPLTAGIAGHVATTGQLVNIPEAYNDPRFNPEVDRRTGYRTRTILCAPLVNRDGEVIGIIQVLNKHTGPFTSGDEDLLSAFCGQAAVAVENAILYEDIQRLFESFVRASVYAIESRDPTTSGHSERVAVLTVELAVKVNRVAQGPLADVRFTEQMLRELRYAALLHDFGKVGVREQVLVKANKLYEPRLELVVSRFNFIKRTLEAEHLRRKVDLLLSGKGEEIKPLLEKLDREYQEKVRQVDEQTDLIAKANKPTVLPEGGFDQLQIIGAQRYEDIDGGAKPYLAPEELADLSIPKGSLNDAERLEIESHVTHTFRFLERIPWTKDLKNIPLIAAAHHEKLDGSGYPSRLGAAEIPVQSRMMTVADIYDALTASDRPYKRAVPPERALDILSMEVKAKKVDPDLFNVFVEARVFDLVTSRGGGAS